MSIIQGGIVSQASIQRELQEGINTIIGLEYKDYSPEYSRMLEVSGSKKAYEEDVIRAGTGLMQVKDEGAAIAYDNSREVGLKRFTHVNYGLGITITQEAIDDGLYGSEMEKGAKVLAKSKKVTKEQNVATMFDNAYSTTYSTTWDSLAIFSASHVLGKGGTYSNMLSVASQLNQSAIEDALIAISGFVDDAGLRLQADGELLIVSRNDRFLAERILGSTLQSNTANNAINALQSLGTFKKGWMVNHYLADTNNWLIKTDVSDGGKFFQRSEYSGADNDFGTSNYRHKVTDRYSFGVSDPRGFFGGGNVA